MIQFIFLPFVSLLLAISSALAAEETEFHIFAVESTGAKFRQAVADAAPSLAKHITLPKGAPDSAKSMSWRVCDLKPGAAVAVVSKLRTRELASDDVSIRISADRAEPNMVSLVFEYHVPNGPWVPSSNGFRPNDTMCIAFAAPDREEGYRIFLICRK